MTYEELDNISDARKGQVRPPDNATLTYSVCGPDVGACGWEGWLLEGASIKVVATNGDDMRGWLPAVTLQICPNCRRTLYRTDTRFEFVCAGETPPFKGPLARKPSRVKSKLPSK